MIELGSKVKDTVSDVEGIVIAKIEYLNGCVRYGIQQKVKKDGTLPETVYVDVEQVEIIKKKVGRFKNEHLS